MNRLFFCLGFFAISFIGVSQTKSSWKEVSTTQKKAILKGSTGAAIYSEKMYTLNLDEFKQNLEVLHHNVTSDSGIVVTIPNASGTSEQFLMMESSNFVPELQAQYPNIRAYSGIGITDPKASISFSISPVGIQTMVLRGGSGSEFIDLISDDDSVYVVSTSKGRKKGELGLNCKTVDVVLNNELSQKATLRKSSSGSFKTLRLALSCTGEYTQYFGGTKQQALAGMNATMTRVNGIFNKDLGLKLVLIANELNIIYTDSATDPYSNASVGAEGAWRTELQNNLTAVIGNANYDIGHLFGASGGGGDAGCIGCVCVNPTASVPDGKGSAFTSPSNSRPEGDAFDIDYVAHEMGHQLGANHVFSNDNERSGVNVEPGSGSTIMGYAGITDYDVQNESDDYFNFASIRQIQNNLANKSCPITTVLNNQTPIVSAGADYTIPIGTAFVLRGTASNASGSTMTYCWEQNDSATNREIGAKSVAYATKPNGPNFRSFLPINSMTRYFPAYDRVLGGQLSSNWESVSTIGRKLNFVFTARNNATAGLGQTNSDAMLVTVDGTKGPFIVTSQSTSNSSWALGSTQTITWSVNDSNLLLGASLVNIKLSTDGGITFPFFLATNTPNDGSEIVVVPVTVSKNCRILIEPTANVFYAVNSVPFALGYSVNTTCNSYAFSGSYSIPESQTYAEKTIVVPELTSEINDVNFNVSFTHKYLSDVQIEVESPKGTVVSLFDKSCGATDSTLVLKYDDAGGILNCGSVTSQIVVPAGVLAAFNGENPQGIWKLRFRDNGIGDTGTINTASIDICSNVYTTLGIAKYEIADFILYPNPNNGVFTISFSSDDRSDIHVSVADMLGRNVFDKKFKNDGNFNQRIDMGNVLSGTYIVTVVNGDRKGNSKIIVR